jgi:hypothetical protein
MPRPNPVSKGSSSLLETQLNEAAFRSSNSFSISILLCCVMSLEKEHPRNYELVDVDVSIISLDNATDTTNGIDTGHSGQAPPSLPTGEVIDSKNTLQSFDAHPSSVPPAIAPDVPMHPMLPGGAMITGKNTLQNFDSEGLGNQPTPISPVIDLRDDRKRSPDEPPISAITTTNSPQTAVAVAVDADIVYGEVATEPVNQSVTVEPTTPWYKRQSTFAFLTIISLLLAVVLGLSIGLSGNGSSGISTPMSAPISTVTTSSPIFSVPTMAPTVDLSLPIRAAVLTSYINNITLSNQTITANGTTPESKALAWMIANDTALDTAAVISKDDPISKNAIGFRIRQRYALLVMWFQQNEFVNWDIVTGWLMNDAECTWYGITCGNRFVIYYFDESNYAVHGYQNAVTQISFNLLGSYVGTIPDDIGLLTTLEHFEIANTVGDFENGKYLQGSLPDSVGQWSALTYFDVRNNGLTGSLPDFIGQWSALNYFAVSFNALTGILPDSLGQWTALTYMDVHLNELNGTLPESIGQLGILTYFDVNDNYFSGTLPGSIGNCTALTYFDASQSSLTGTLPDSIGLFTAMIDFNICCNNLNGTLPGSIGQWTALTAIDASYNEFTGTIPSSIGNWSMIHHAVFEENHFVGTMPIAICEFIDLEKGDFLQVNCEVNCSCCNDYNCI